MTAPPLTLARLDSYFAGGRAITVAGQPVRPIRFSPQAALEHDPNGTYWIEQAYVQVFEPAQTGGRRPLVLVHGGCLTGSAWENTPDGRPGWLHHFLRAGFPVHLVDAVERGRAGWCALPGQWPETPVMRSAQEMWTLYRFGAAQDCAAKRPYSGQRFPVAALDALMQRHVPRWFSTIPAATTALLAVLERTGPAIVLSHSNGGLIACQAAWQRPDLIAGLVAAEPSGFPDSDPPAALAGTPVLLVMGDFLDRNPLWAKLSTDTRLFGERLARHGARVDGWWLPDQGITGNSHMMMMDDNSEALAARIVAWMDRNVSTAP